MIEIPEFTKDDYLQSLKPFEWLYSFHDNRLQMRQLMTRISEAAKTVGVKNFAGMFSDYLDAQKNLGNTSIGENMTNFSNQQISLWCGSWEASDNGITTTNGFGQEIQACSHPIYPIRLLKNLDTGLEKIELRWQRGEDDEQGRIFQKSIIANANKIVGLADYGIAVNSENAKHLVRYLHDVESLNYDRLDRANSVGRLGWIDGYGFSPYIENLVFDGEDAFADRFASVQPCGSYSKWTEAIKSFRARESPIIRIVFAASLASCLVKIAGIMPFVVHIWGRGGSGKTVVMMVAASIWGNPEIGRYIKSFNSTGVGKEMGAVFLNSLPLMLDELQIATRDKDKLRQMIYELTEGVGRERGRKEGGLQKSGTWRNTVITTGEQPIVESSWTEGAKYRTIEIRCSGERFFENGNSVGKNAKEVVGFITRHYGHFGRDFVTRLTNEKVEVVTGLHDKYAEQIRAAGDIDTKQALAAALILTADTLAEQWYFHDGIRLSVRDIMPHLITQADADQDKRAYEFLQEAVGIYQIHFNPAKAEEKGAEIWGEVKDHNGRSYAAFYNTPFHRLLENEGYSSSKFVDWARQNGALRLSKDGKSTIATRIGGAEPKKCYWVLIEQEQAEDDEYDDILPL